jgi:hypothetical protein
MKRLLLALSLALVAASSFALPTVEAVQAEVAKGRYPQAEAMMREVVAARPGSARAHYVYAEILAHDRRFEQAAAELARARQIDPSDKYTDRARLDAFSALLEREQAAARRTQALPVAPTQSTAPAPAVRDITPAGGGVPGWVWGLGGGLLALAAWRMVRARSQGMASSPAGASYASPGGALSPGMPGMGGAPGYGYGPAYPQQGPGAGSGMLGTGMAVAGGVAAGMLAERVFEGLRDGGGHGAGSLGAGPRAGSLGAGLGSGSLDGDLTNPAARELEERPIDFGAGDGWGADAGDNSGGSSDDGGW